MALKITKFNPNGCEAKVLKHLETIYKKVDYDAYLLHDNLLCFSNNISFKPDFIILDPIHGISIIEVKSYKEKELDKIENNIIYFRSGGQDVCPFKKAQDYAFKLKDYLASHGIKITPDMIKTNLVFTNLPVKFFKDYPFVETRYKNYKKSLTIEGIFPNKIEHTLQIERINTIMNPVTYFNTSIANNNDISKLDDEQLDFVKKPIAGHYLISGIPGSGKSIAIISRAVHISNQHPDWNILILSENKKLKNKNELALESRVQNFEKLGQSPSSHIQCKTLYSLLRELCKARVPSSLTYPEQLEFMASNILSSDIDPIYDAVLIDEYQDFTDEQLIIAKIICKKKTTIINKKDRLIENIFLAGDKLQKIKDKGGSENWIELGYEIKGHSKNLKGSYRCGRGILDLALNFLMSGSKSLNKEVHSYYEGIDNIDYLGAIESKISVHVSWLDQGIAKIRNWVANLIKSGVDPAEIIIICPNNKKQKLNLENVFSDEIASGLVIGMPSTIKGLEASYCALFNFGSYGYHQSSADNKYKEIYMCLTRARKGLFIHCCKSDNIEFQKVLEVMKNKGILFNEELEEVA